RTVAAMRTYFADVLDDALRLPVLPEFLNGFVLALNFAPGIARFVVELLSYIFGAVTDGTLLPWLPSLILQLRKHQRVLQPLIKEASTVFPTALSGFANWQPQWLDSALSNNAQPANDTINGDISIVRQLLAAQPEIANALAMWLRL